MDINQVIHILFLKHHMIVNQTLQRKNLARH
ncbi:hypothetical protein Leryth_004502 [Lithospermum erythrorhizon]|nr:hypothetical protein Leryth_004502 [Lithospermum erythrorhizon]